MWKSLIKKYEINKTYRELNQNASQRLINEKLKNIEVKKYDSSSTYGDIRISSSNFDIYA